jgi:hypothetical protein
LGLVVAGGVEGEGPDEFAILGDDADVSVCDEEHDDDVWSGEGERCGIWQQLMVSVDVQRELHFAGGDPLHDPVLADDHLDEAMLLVADRLTLPEHAAYGTGPLGFLTELRDVPRLEMEELFVGHAPVALAVGLQREIAGVFDVDDRIGMDEECGLSGGIALLDSTRWW